MLRQTGNFWDFWIEIRAKMPVMNNQEECLKQKQTVRDKHRLAVTGSNCL